MLIRNQAYPTEHGLYASCLPPHRTIGPSQATPSLLIGVVLSPRTDMWGAVTNTGYDSMPTSLGIARTQIHCLRQGSVADKPRTSRCPSVSVADITDCECATSPAKSKYYAIFFNIFSSSIENYHLQYSTRVKPYRLL